MVRPHAECNHIKWQLGHLIASEHQMISGCMPAGTIPDLPDGFADRYTKEQAKSDDPAAFHSKDELLSAYANQRAATLQALESVTTEQLDGETPEPMRGYAPTVAAAFIMQETHWTMHAGQWAVIRRMLGRPPLF